MDLLSITLLNVPFILHNKMFNSLYLEILIKIGGNINNDIVIRSKFLSDEKKMLQFGDTFSRINRRSLKVLLAFHSRKLLLK